MKMLRWLLCLALLVTPAAARFPHGAVGGGGGGGGGGLPSGFSMLNESGGGFVTGLDYSPDGLTILARTDVGGGYIFSGGQWQQLLTGTRFGTTAALAVESGVVEIVAAPSNSSIIYLWTNNKIYKSTDRGATFNACNGSTFSAVANGGFPRLRGRKMAVDPTNSAVIILGVQDGSNGAYISRDSCATFSAISGPTTGAASYSIVFETGGGNATCPIVGGTCTKDVVIAPYGSQAYRSVDAAASFTVTASGPSHIGRLASLGSVIWATDEVTDTTPWRLSGTTWAQSPATTGPVRAVAIDPTNSARVVVAAEQGYISYATNGNGAIGSVSWTNVHPTSTCPTTPWLCFLGPDGFMESFDIIFNPAGTSLWMAGGIGSWTINPGTTTVWVDNTKGQSTLTSNGVFAPPWLTNHPIVFGWDRQMAYLTPGTEPSVIQTNNVFNNVWSIDYASSGTLAVALIDGGLAGSDPGSDLSAKSTDGLTWTPLPSVPSLINTTATVTASNGTSITIGAGVPSTVYPGMGVIDTTKGYNNAFPGGASVVSIPDSTHVTINGTITNITSGDNIQFQTGPSGAVAASTTTNWMWSSANSAPFLYFTTNGGTSWAQSAFPATAALGGTQQPFSGTANTTNGQITGISINTNKLAVGWSYADTTGNCATNAPCTISSIDSANSITISKTGTVNGTVGFQPIGTWENAYYDNTVPIAADRVNTGTFYAWNAVTGFFYISTDNGATFTKQADVSGIFGHQEVLMKTVPGNAGHIIMTSTLAFAYSKNAGVSWTSVPNFTTGGAFGIGKIAAGHTYPTIFANGSYFGTGGSLFVWKSVDFDQATPTWQALGVGNISAVTLQGIGRIEGDKNIEGQAYFSFSGTTAAGFGP